MSTDLSDGQAFGAYTIVAMAGSGGMGVVYRAEQRSLGRIVALKVIRPEIAGSGDYRARFMREARLAAAVNHPHVVSVFEVGEQAGRLYLTMQWVDGQELRALLRGGRRLDPDRAVAIGGQLASALNAVHEAGLVHRDVKPSNVLVRDIGGRDHAYLTDFGIAKIPDAQDGLTRTGWTIGTSGYLSPEQIRGSQPDSRSDLYALGCVVFEALTGQRPFSGDSDLAVSYAHASSPRPAASALCPALGPRFDAFLVRALAVDPQDRFQTGRDFADALQSAASPDRGTAPTAPTSPHAPIVAEPLAAEGYPATELGSRHAPEPTAAAGAGQGPGGRPPGAPQRAYPATELGSRQAPEPTAVAGTGRPPAGRPTGAPEPTIRGAAGIAGTGAAPTVSAPPGSARRAAPPGTPAGGTGRPPAGAGRRKSRAGGVGRFVAAAGGIVFVVAVTRLTSYSNNGNGAKSLLQAATHDPASPLVPANFWISVALAAVAAVLAIVSAGRSRRPLMIIATLASLALVGYTLYIPQKGSSPGFGPYGPSYWLSLAAAAVVLLGAVTAAAARSRPR